MKLKLIETEPRLICNRRGEHLDASRSRGGDVFELVRRNRCRNEDHLVEP